MGTILWHLEATSYLFLIEILSCLIWLYILHIDSTKKYFLVFHVKCFAKIIYRICYRFTKIFPHVDIRSCCASLVSLHVCSIICLHKSTNCHWTIHLTRGTILIELVRSLSRAWVWKWSRVVAFGHGNSTFKGTNTWLLRSWLSTHCALLITF